MHIGDVAGFLASLCAWKRHWWGEGGRGVFADRRLETGNWLVAGKASGEYTFNS